MRRWSLLYYLASVLIPFPLTFGASSHLHVSFFWRLDIECKIITGAALKGTLEMKRYIVQFEAVKEKLHES